MAVKAWELESTGSIVLSCHLLPRWFCPVEDHFAETQNINEAMDRLHLAKIDLADEVFVMNVTGYVGESTQREIEYCWHKNKKIEWLESDKAIIEPNCDRCRNARTIQALGCGGDYETFFCPKCRPEEFAAQTRGF
jgi:hypothetical protein